MPLATNKIELLAPAGSPEALDAAVGEGADAVYLGLKDFNARMRSANFTYAQFENALRVLHRKGKKIYVTVNTVFQQREADRMYQLLKYLAALGPDALIVQDFGVVALARAEFPSLKLHASTQMNIASGRGANALSRHGVSRVVLARELSLTELHGIRCETNLELEVFVHGALCVSASGLCLFSSYLGGKSANRGMCTQACRRLYRRSGGGAVAPDEGYYFSPGDLQLLENLPDLAAAGINALKIEGRMKSADYVGAVVSAYRLVLDAVMEADGPDDAGLLRAIERGREILRTDFARSKTQFYFYDGQAPANWLNAAQDGGTGISLGPLLKVKGAEGARLGLVSVTDGTVPAVGDSVRMHKSDDTERVSHKLKFAERESDGHDGNTTCWISIPEGFKAGDRVYLIQTKAMSRRYEHIIAHNGSENGRRPGGEKAPVPEIKPAAKRAKSTTNSGAASSGVFPEGLYVAVSRADDLYIVQSSRPVRVMLAYNRKNINRLLADAKTPLPFKPAEIILNLDPWFPQNEAQTMPEAINRLMEKGYRQFVLNNPGHCSLFRNNAVAGCDAVLIAGPWLYTFNAWALSLVSAWGVDAFISPLENNRQNLDRTLTFVRRTLGGENRQARDLRSRFFIPVFAWPALFRIRADLGQLYDFDQFADNRDEQFSLLSGPDGSTVIPEQAFSITDKIPFLKESGFGRFIIDLSGPVLKKGQYRDLMRTVSEGTPLPGVSRFNWKDGFFQLKAE